MTTRQLELDFRFVDEPVPGRVWGELFAEYWPAFRRWYFKPSTGGGTRPDYATCQRMLRRYLPSMIPVCEALTELAGGGDDAARFLTLYSPPPSIRGCTQAVWQRDGEIALVRNYDFAPKLCDGVVLRSAWSGVGVIAMTDCLVGALDGMNEHGLAASLAFGGDKAVGAGFGTTVLVRAALESCSTVAQAVALLRGVPVHMAYSVTLVDRGGAHATLHLHPQRAAQVTASAVTTNHQMKVAWPEHARFSQTLERQRHVESMLGDDRIDIGEFTGRFLEPPLYRRGYARGSGTLYTAVYSPASGTLDLYWPGAHKRVGFDSFPVGTHVARYEPQSAVSGG